MRFPSIDPKIHPSLPAVAVTPIRPGSSPAPVLLSVQATEQDEAITAAIDRVRRDLAHDLHDGLGQILAALALRARLIERELATEFPAAAAGLAEIVQGVSDAILEARQVAQGVDPIRLRGDGLAAALRALCAGTERGSGLRCRFHHDLRAMALTDHDARHLYRIAQEAIANAIRHGEASQIDIVLNVTAGRFTLVIHDNGLGFASNQRAGMGMRSMLSRAASLGGELTIASNAEAGTSVRCTVPTSARGIRAPRASFSRTHDE